MGYTPILRAILLPTMNTLGNEEAVSLVHINSNDFAERCSTKENKIETV